MPLTCLYLKLTLIPALIFTILIALIRAQPYDNSQLRVLLTSPETCPVPCFRGIRPGVTTLDQAYAILQGQADISEIDFNPSTQRISFTWDTQSAAYPSSLRAEDGIVSAIFIPTRLPLQDYWLTFGAPEQVIGIASPSNISYVLRDTEQRIEVWFRQGFPVDQGLKYLLESEITLVFLDDYEDGIPTYANPSLRDFLSGDTIIRFS